MRIANFNRRLISFGWTLFAFLWWISLDSCKQGAQPWESFGDIVQERRELLPFDKIRVRGKLLLYLYQDSNQQRSAVIHWGEHVLPGLVTEVNQEGELLIEDRNSARWLRRLDTQAVCSVNVWGIQSIIIEDNVQVEVLDTLNTPLLEVQTVSTHRQKIRTNCGQLFGFIRGTGSVIFEGKGVIFSWSCEKGGSVDARNLESDDVYLWHFTQRNVWVDPSKQFEAHCFGDGNIFYKKEPEIRFFKSEQGTGRVLKMP